MKSDHLLSDFPDSEIELLGKIINEFEEQTKEKFFSNNDSINKVVQFYRELEYSINKQFPKGKEIQIKIPIDPPPIEGFSYNGRYKIIEEIAYPESKRNLVNELKKKGKEAFDKITVLEKLQQKLKKKQLENELLKSSLIPVSQNEVTKVSKGKNDNYGKVQQRLLDLLKKDNIKIEECDKIPSPKLNKYGLIIEKEGLTKNKKTYKNERSRISSIRKILSDIREKEKLVLKKDKT